MDKRGSAGDNVLTWNTSYFILGVLFFILAFFWIVGFQDGAARWGDFYAKEISGIIDLAQPEQDIWLDVTPATRIGLKNGKLLSEMFIFNNEDHSVSVSLGPKRGNRFFYFNKVKIVDVRVEAPSGSATTNRLHFKIVEEK